MGTSKNNSWGDVPDKLYCGSNHVLTVFLPYKIQITTGLGFNPYLPVGADMKTEIIKTKKPIISIRRIKYGGFFKTDIYEIKVRESDNVIGVYHLILYYKLLLEYRIFDMRTKPLKLIGKIINGKMYTVEQLKQMLNEKKKLLDNLVKKIHKEQDSEKNSSKKSDSKKPENTSKTQKDTSKKHETKKKKLNLKLKVINV